MFLLSLQKVITALQAVTIFVAMQGKKIGQLQRKSPILYPVFGSHACAMYMW